MTTSTSTTSTTVAALAAGAAGTVSSASTGGFAFLTHYYISPIALLFFLVYAVSFVLYKTKRIKVATHRKIWNVLLMVTFLITGIFGLLLTIQLDYKLPFTIPFDLLFWHVEAGIIMTLISLFHLGWHFKYYAKLLQTGRAKAKAAQVTERAAARRAAAGLASMTPGAPYWETESTRARPATERARSAKPPIQAWETTE